MILARHLLANLALLDRAGLVARAVAGLLPPFRTDAVAARVEDCLGRAALPGIVCRPTLELAPGEIQLGLSFPFREDGARVRSAIAVAERAIPSFTDPFAIALGAEALGAPLGPCLRAAITSAATRGVRLGVIGSAALEIVTGLAYTSEASDLDLVLAAAPCARLHQFAVDLARIGAAHGIHVDAEVDLGDGCGVKLDEVLSSSRSLLAKTLDDVRLLERSEVMAAL